MNNKHKKGFTLIEVIIYTALFSLLLGSAFVVAYRLIDGSDGLSEKNIIQEEGNFVMRKLNWAMTGAKTFSASGSSLTVYKYDKTTVKIKLGSGVDAEKILMDDTGSFLPITTDNVKVSSLIFQYIPAIGSGSSGITATAKISGIDFIVTKYIRK